MSISKCVNVISKLSLTNLTVRETVYFIYVYKNTQHVTKQAE